MNEFYLRNVVMRNSTKKTAKKMRVAVFFSGRITAYEHSSAALENLCKRYNCTLFCSLNKSASNPYLNNFFSKYNIDPSRINFEKTVYPEWLFKLKKHPWSKYDNLYSSLYHNKRAFDLIEDYVNLHKFKFDAVVFFRSDIYTYDPLILLKPAKNTVYVPEGFNGGHPPGFLEQLKMSPEEYGINSTLGYGSYNSMKIYCGIVDRLHEICINNSVDFHHERLIKRGLELAGVNIHLFKYKYELHPKRHNSHYNLS
jgi:hypothetical protein